MWSTVLILAGSVIFEPIRLGLVILLLNRRRPLLQLLAFLCGGLTMGLGVGLVVLFALRATPVIGHLTVAEVQVGCGLIAVLVALIALVLPTNILARKAIPSVAAPGAGSVAVLERPAGGVQRLAELARGGLRGDALHVAAISGLAAALPSANYMGSMAAILASHAAPLAQVQALLAFNLVAFTVAELPLVGYLAAPQQTRALTAALQTWLRSRTRRDAAALVATGGCFMLALGLSNL